MYSLSHLRYTVQLGSLGVTDVMERCLLPDQSASNDDRGARESLEREG